MFLYIWRLTVFKLFLFGNEHILICGIKNKWSKGKDINATAVRTVKEAGCTSLLCSNITTLLPNVSKHPHHPAPTPPPSADSNRLTRFLRDQRLPAVVVLHWYLMKTITSRIDRRLSRRDSSSLLYTRTMRLGEECILSQGGKVAPYTSHPLLLKWYRDGLLPRATADTALPRQDHVLKLTESANYYEYVYDDEEVITESIKTFCHG